MTLTTLQHYRYPVLTLAIITAIISALALPLRIPPEIFFRAYLYGYLYILGLALGSLALLMLHTLTGGEWGDRIRPFLAAASRSLPLLALLFLPIAFNLNALYPWADPANQTQELIAHRHTYLNPTFLNLRAAAYFIIWITLALMMTSAKRSGADALIGRRLPRQPNADFGTTHPRALPAAGLILYLVTMTHVGVDWIMSRDTDFYSTAFGFILVVGQTLSALALAITLTPFLPPIIKRPDPHHRPPLLNDLGNLQLTTVILWAYVSFIQLLVIWMGNTREDNTYYVLRGLSGDADAHTDGFAWRMVALTLVLFHFFIPFYLLLFRKIKQNQRTLVSAAIMLLLAHALDQYWLIAPSGHHLGPIFNPHWLDLTVLLALASIWFTAFLFLLRRPTTPAPAQASALPAQGVPA